MKNNLITLTFILCCSNLFCQNNFKLVTYDINNFWTAYDKIITTKDTVAQVNFINQIFISKGSPGLKAIMQARNYTDKSYLYAINNYPLFWNSVRGNTLKVNEFANEIETAINKIKNISFTRI